MSGNDNRHLARDSLFVMADMRVDGFSEEFRVKIRNLSSGGLMGEGGPRLQRGMLLSINIRNIGWVEGSVAWVQATRFGVAFLEEIDPKVARDPITSGERAPIYSRPHHWDLTEGTKLRKI